MLMVVFGAGASYDSVPEFSPSSGVKHDERPPLANELFADRAMFTQSMGEFPQCLPIVPYLRHLNGKGLERVLEELQREGSEYPERFRQIAAVRFYLRSMLWKCVANWNSLANGITNYRTLLDQIERWTRTEKQVCLVTFNYDTMLEDALRDFGVRTSSLGDYIGHRKYKIVKVHGSVNWCREVSTPLQSVMDGKSASAIRQELIDRNVTLNITNRYTIVNGSSAIVTDFRTPLFPAIAIPLENKNEFECPEDHLQLLSEALPMVRKLLVVGWRATDRPFIDLVRSKKHGSIYGMVVASNGGEAKDIGHILSGHGVLDDFVIAEGGFSETVITRAADSFLRA